MALAYEGATVVSDNVWPEYSGLQHKDAIADVIAAPAVTYNPEAAEQYFTEAGYAKDADGFWAKDGERLAPC